MKTTANNHNLNSFDPALPEDGALIIAGVLRDQFNGLNAFIQERVTEEEMIQARNDAIATAEASSANACSQVQPLSMNAAMDYEQSQLQEIIEKLNQLINALQR